VSRLVVVVGRAVDGTKSCPRRHFRILVQNFTRILKFCQKCKSERNIIPALFPMCSVAVSEVAMLRIINALHIAGMFCDPNSG
jgi:hypothetical protein